MYFCLLFLSVYAIQLVAGDPYETGPSIKKLLPVKVVVKKSPPISSIPYVLEYPSSNKAPREPGIPVSFPGRPHKTVKLTPGHNRVTGTSLPTKPVAKEPEKECTVKGKVVKHGQSVVVKSTCTKYSCHVRKGSSVKILDQELLKDCFGLKCVKKGDVWARTMDDKLLETTCNDQLQVIVTRADCVFGGSIVENGDSFQDFTTCTKYMCKVNNVGQEIRHVKLMEEREPIKDCSQ